MRRLILVLILIVTYPAWGQYPTDYFGSPLDIQLQLSGNFGELRSNHFHSGFDFKTNQTEGYNIYAVADGYVSRIKISEGGYGKAIYITHPNGYTSVYGHLQSGFGVIENYIRKQQYLLKSYEMDINLAPTDLVVKKCDQIAISGNSGGSEGPHLHFEIRDTQSEKIINPLFFGFDKWMSDTQPPSVKGLWVFPVEEGVLANQSVIPIMLSLTKQSDGSYIAGKVIAKGKIGFGINAYDYDSVSRNANGVYSVQTFVNGKPDFCYRFDTFSFDETRYVNALIDYGRYKTTGDRIQKLFSKNPYPLSLLLTGDTAGVLDVKPNVIPTFSIELADFQGNKTKIYVPVQYSSLPPKILNKQVTTKYLVKAGRENIFSEKNKTVTFPENVFLEDFYMDFETKDRSVKVHKDVIPAFANFSVSFEETSVPEKDKEKMFIGLAEGSKIYFFNTRKYHNTFTTYSKTLGEYRLLKDSIAPKIMIRSAIEGKWISKETKLQFFISDDLSGIKSYEGYLNGKWILFEFDRKTGQLVYYFSDGIADEGKNELKLTVTDNVGNSAIFETHFFRTKEP